MVLDSQTLEYLTALKSVEHWRETIGDARMFANDGQEPAAPLRTWLEAVGADDDRPLIPDSDSDLSWIPAGIIDAPWIAVADVSILFVDPARVTAQTAELVNYGRAVQRFAAERWPRPGCMFMRTNPASAISFLEETDTIFLSRTLVLADEQLTVSHIVSLIAASDLATMPYGAYLQSAHWQSIRRDAQTRAKNRCQLCNSRKKPLHTHHNSYERRGYENPDDLIVLCANCHAKFHDKLPKDRQ